MITKDTIFTLTIPEWKNKVPVGRIAPQYYKKGSKLPSKHKGAKLKKFGRSSFYVMGSKKIVKNPTKAGKPKFWNLNGQQFYTTNMHWSTRSTIMNFYHSYFTKYIKKQFKKQFPVFLSHSLEMNIEIYEIFSSKTPDITNMWLITKLFEDSMVKTGILIDDCPEYRRKTSYEYIFVEKEEDRKLLITFKYDKIK